MAQQDKTLGFFSLCRKAGKLSLGRDQLEADCHAHRVRLLILASDTASNTALEISRLSKEGDPPVITLDRTQTELGDCVGRPACAFAGITDAGMALALFRSLPPEQQTSDGMAVLERRARRADKRRQPKRSDSRRKSG